ncbi:hypothetical protein C8R43DRAFT_997430 [Mycena crocata]|nr:hypothetical protein C8R43DRAFT_997430 [Mycena crocata]
MTPSLGNLQLGRLPTELLLIIINSLCEINIFPSMDETKVSGPHYTRHLCSLSLVSRWLHQLCIPLLFRHLKFTDAQNLRLFQVKCFEDGDFARQIRTLDLVGVQSCDDLMSLLPLLESLEWLDVASAHLDASLLSTVNAHPTVTTVAVSDQRLHFIRNLSSAASISLSKILVYSVISTCIFTMRCPELRSLARRGLRVAHLTLCGESNVMNGPGTLSLPGLEKLTIAVYCWPTFLMSWLPGFAKRHRTLSTINFEGDQYGSSWRHHPDIIFPLQLIDAMERDGLTRHMASLNGFSLSPPNTASPLGSWEVSELRMTIEKPVGVSALKVASSVFPNLRSLVIQMPRLGKQPIDVNDLVSPLGRFSALQRLNLRNMYKHLLFEGTMPCTLASDPPRKTSNCLVAHATLKRVATLAAQCALSLELTHVTDEGDDRDGRSRHPWRLDATYQVQPNRDVEAYGTPKFTMAKKYRMKK